MRHPISPSLAPDSGGVDDSAAPTLAQWERLMRTALDARTARRLEVALAVQVRALWTAEALFESPLLQECPDDCLAALVVSHHNLADLYYQRAQAPQAIAHLCLPHRELQRLAGSDAQPVAVQQAARRHLRETRAQLLIWLRARGADPGIEAVLDGPTLSEPAERPVRLH